MTDDFSPRLPPRVEPVELPLEPPRMDPAEQVLKTSWSPFPEPDLLATNRIRPVVIVARVLVFVWGAALVIAAVAARSNATGGLDEGTTIGLIGWLGLPVTLLLAAVGWRWSDRKAQNVHMLEARLPTRFRCGRAWLAPLVWFGVLAGTVLQLEPTELLDVRPPIVVPIFAAALWRPYALVRRTLTSLIRVRSDALIGTAYVLDLAAFGLLWWQLWTLPDFITPSNVGNVDVFIGVSAAAALALGANTLIWVLLVRTVERAEAHRLVAIRTRHDHRQLRLRGIDPMDRQVRWALLRIKRTRDEELSAEAATAEDARERAAREWVESMLHPSRRAAAKSKAPVDTPVLPPREAVPKTRVVPAPDVVVEPSAAPAPEVAAPEVVGRSVAPTPDVTAPEAPARATPPIEIDEEPLVPAADVLARDHPSTTQSPEVDKTEPVQLEALDVPETTVPNLREIEPEQAQPAGPRVARLRDVLRQPPESVEPPDRHEDRLGRHVRSKEEAAGVGVSGESLLNRLAEYGITPGPVTNEPAIDSWMPSALDEEREGWVPPRVYPLEMARYILVLAIVAIVTTSVWITYRSVSVGRQLVDGLIGTDEVDDLELARRAVVVSLGIATAMVPLWALALTAYGRRAGLQGLGRWRLGALFVVALACNVLAFVLDGATRGTITLLFLAGSLAAAVVSAWLLDPVQRWLGPRLITAAMWTAAMALLVLTSWVGGLQRPVEASDALEALTFFSAFITIVACVIAVVVALSTADFVDEVQLALAEPDSSDEPEADGAEPAAGIVVEPVAEPLVEPAAGIVVEPVAEPVVEPLVEPAARIVVEPVVEPAAEPFADRSRRRRVVERTKKRGRAGPAAKQAVAEPIEQVSIIELDGVGITESDETLFDRVSVEVSTGDRVAIVGPSGSGKSTLIRIMAGTQQPDTGSVRFADGVRIALVDQDPQLPPGSVAEYLGSSLEDDGTATLLGVRPLLDTETDQLSVGQATRVALAKALLGDYDMIALDEPTNHLDLDVINWLGQRLTATETALVVITHDRHLMDRLTTGRRRGRTVELDHGSLHVHPAGPGLSAYVAYLDRRVTRSEQATREEAARKVLVRRELEWLRRGAPARTDRPKAELRSAEAAAMVADESIALIDVSGAHGSHVVVRDVSLLIEPAARLGIVGPVESGKSTLLDIVAGELDPASGEVVRGANVAIGYLDQHPAALDPEAIVRDVAAGPLRPPDLEDRVLLERFWFDLDAQHAPIKALSSGERRRLQLVTLLATKPNVLVLDEPTNHLDLDTLRALESFLDEWPGALVVASHDRAFLDRTVDHVLAIEGDGALRRVERGVQGWLASRMNAEIDASDILERLRRRLI